MHRCQPFAPEHADEISALCAAEGWPSWTPERTRSALGFYETFEHKRKPGVRIYAA